MELLGIELTDEEFDKLMCEQAKGKELKVVDGNVVAVEHEVTEEERKQQRIYEIKTWFEEYDNQVKQYERCKRLGITFDKDMVELDKQAQVYQNELRPLLGKEPREYIKGEES
jgi:hypothetical protein